MKRRILFLAAVFALTLGWMAVQKPLFLLFYGAGVPAGDWLRVVLHGLTLDLTMAGYATAPLLLVVIASVWIQLGERTWRVLSMIWLSLFSVVAAAIVAVDLGLYGYWGFRLDGTVLIYLSDPAEAMASVTLREALLQGTIMICIAAAMIAGYAAACRMLRAGRVRLRLLATLLLLLLCGLDFLAIRGGLSVAAANVSKVYFSDRMLLNHAAINPVFSFLSSAGKPTDYAAEYPFFQPAELAEQFAPLRGDDKSDAGTPRLLATDRPDVVVVILESFGSTFMDEQVDGRWVMPNMRRFSREGIWFENFFANSFRTDRGEAAILSGYPAQTRMSIMKLPAKSRTLPSLARSLGREGYRSLFVYGGDLNFTNQSSYMYGTGWQELVQQKDLRLDAPTSKWGYADDAVTDYFAGRVVELASDGRPFLAGLLTLSSHEPFEVPFDRFEDKVLNAMAYTDDCLGRMIERLRCSPAWDNLLVVLVADHAYGYPYGIAYNTPLRHRIPMIWLGGAVEAAHTVDRYASQIDLAATLLAQMGIDHSDYLFSKNILSADTISPPPARFAYYTFNDGFGVVDSQGATVYDCTADAVVEQSGTGGERRLMQGKAMLQSTYLDIEERR